MKLSLMQTKHDMLVIFDRSLHLYTRNCVLAQRGIKAARSH